LLGQMSKILSFFARVLTAGHRMKEGGGSMTFCELKQKDGINICDGRRLGKPIDLALNDSACVSALIVPGPSSFLGCFKPDREGLSIPWEHIRRIGDDVILVELDANFGQ